MKIFIISLVAFVVCGCSSMPLRSIPNSIHSEENISLGKVAITGCETISLDVGENNHLCTVRSIDLESVLLKTNLFSEIVKNKDEADYLIYIKKSTEGPTLFYLKGNVECIVLALVFPLWENYDYGYNLEITNTRKNEIYQLTDIETGAHIFWSASFLLNLQSDRGMTSTYRNNEAHHLRNIILNTVM